MTPPNLVFIFTDEQRYDTFAQAGNDWIQTPNLSRLAGESCHFEQAYCTQPVCTPSRSSIMTGLYPHATGAYMNNEPLRSDVPCLPEMLEGDHTSAYIGKWHLGDELFAQHGFDHWVSMEDGYERFFSPGRDRNTISDYAKWLIGAGFKPDMNGAFSRQRACNLPEPWTKPAFLANRACEFLHEHRDSPFVMYVNFLEPHMPFFGPWTGRYDPDTIPMPGNFDDPPADDHGLAERMQYERWRRGGFEWYDLSGEAGWRQMAAAYAGLCTLIDHHTGRVLDAIDRLGLRDNTIVVFTSDHGEMMGSHRLLGKGAAYQESVRVPLLLRLPGQRDAQRITGPVSQIDLVPTLLDLLGQDIPGHLHGQSLLPMLGGGGAEHERDVFVQWNTRYARKDGCEPPPVPGWVGPTLGVSEQQAQLAQRQQTRTIITADGWRFSCHPELHDHQLFNLNDDPLERANLAGDPAQRSRMTMLLGRLCAWQERVADDVALPAELAGEPVQAPA